MSNVTREKFVQALGEIYSSNEEREEELSVQLRKALLDFASRSEDNLHCASRIEVGTVATTWGADLRGMKVAGKNVLLSDVLCALEEGAIPPAVLQELPDLSQEDWQAAIRATFLVMRVFEKQR